MNRAFCGKSTKFGTHVHDTKKSKFSYSAKPDFPCGGCGSHLKKWPLCHYISETKRRRAIIFDSIYRFSGAYISEKVLPNTSCHCSRHFGGHLCKMAAIYKLIRLSQKLRGAEPSISTLRLGFVGRGFQKTYCRIHHAIVSTILEAI